MADIIKNPEFEKLVSAVQELETELADLVFERDKLLYHVCPKLQTEYILKIGKLEYAVFEYQCKILRAKRKIELIQAQLNKEQPFNIADIEKQLDKEYREYYEKLLEKQKEIDEARFRKDSKGKSLTDDESAELKKLYTYIVKRLHPDINPDTTAKQHELFNDAVIAYKNADLPELKIISLLLEKTSVTTDSASTMEKLTKRKESLLVETTHITEQIQKIKETFPYSIKDLLLNENDLQKKIDECTILLTELQEQHETIEKRLESMLK
jgi:ABC-type Na+ efflux pump permease subunit